MLLHRLMLSLGNNKYLPCIISNVTAACLDKCCLIPLLKSSFMEAYCHFHARAEHTPSMGSRACISVEVELKSSSDPSYSIHNFT